MARATTANTLGTVIRAAGLHVSKPTWWLTSRFHFNFADYAGGENEWGDLRVLNDDIVEGNSGFGPHPHSFYSIFSYVVDGKLSHADSMGNRETLGRGAFQYMCAGTGVRHSEMNDDDDPCRFLQIWVKSSARNLDPEYGSVEFSREDRANTLLHAIKGRANETPAGHDATVTLPADVNVYVSELDIGASVEYTLAANRQLYAVCIEGDLVVSHAESGDQASLAMRDAFKLVASDSDLPIVFAGDKTSSHLLFIEMARST